MANNPQPNGTASRRSALKAGLLEAVFVALAGAALALVANAVSPRGLALTEDYFPKAAPVLPAPVAITNPPVVVGSATNVLTVLTNDPVAARLKAASLEMVNLDSMQQLFRDPRYAQQQIVFVDARSDDLYKAGHIPSAWQLDHYRAANYLTNVLPVCLKAERVVVYCIGSECEDSEFTAILLRNNGVPNTNLSVFAGGFTEWSAKKLPIETGARASSQTQEVKP
jgi:rhodanese-related sulfurtransferase